MQTFVRVPLPLTHLFTALYLDGTTFTQPQDDAPKQARPDGTGSAYGDMDHDNVRVFFLEGNGNLYQVHLDDGHFEINGVVVVVGDDTDVPLGPRRLIYFRRVAHDHITNLQSGEGQVGETRRSYHLGWEADRQDAVGGTVRRTIEVGHEVFRS